MKLSHYYHVYCDGDWREPVTEHVAALGTSGLYDQLDNVYVGFVGTPENCGEAEAWMQDNLLHFTTLTYQTEGFEQVTMGFIEKHAPFMADNDMILYAHTKGSWAATQPSPPQREDHIEFNRLWRRSMQHDMVTRWRECVALLDHHDAVGSHVIPEFLNGEPVGGPYYAGTWWWATAKHIRSLPPLLDDHRYRAEKWIGDRPDADLYELRTGWPGYETLWNGEV